jgi:hypothetical protein
MQKRVCRCLNGCLKHGINVEKKELADNVVCGYELIRNNRLIVMGPGPEEGTVEIEVEEDSTLQDVAEGIEIPTATSTEELAAPKQKKPSKKTKKLE